MSGEMGVEGMERTERGSECIRRSGSDLVDAFGVPSAVTIASLTREYAEFTGLGAEVSEPVGAGGSEGPEEPA